MTMAAIRAISAPRFRPGGVVWRSRSGAERPVSMGPASGFLSGIGPSGMNCGPGSGRLGGVTAVNDAEDHGNEDQGGAGGENQATDHGAAQRRVLFPALTQAQRHWTH